ncbi:MAG: glycosyltransferase family 9 protein [Candidatus Methylacidiphilales bacterium]|nr:glycosyltransferase family 9 protein [Candidatus Methylacidiphilales bacterium]
MNPAPAAAATVLCGATPVSAARPVRASWSMRVAAVLVPLIAKLYARRPGVPAADASDSRPKRILILRRNRMGDMLCAYPLIRAIRLAYPEAVIHIACDKAALAVAQACPHADGAILLRPGWHRWHMALRNAGDLQGYDVAVAVKGGFDLVLASLLRLTNAPMRIGFRPKDSERSGSDVAISSEISAFYTHILPPPPWGEHQMETCLRLAGPLLAAPTKSRHITDIGSDIHAAIRDGALRISPDIRRWADDALTRIVPGFSHAAGPSRFALINISSTTPLKWKDAYFQEFVRRLVHDLSLPAAFVFAPADQPRAEVMVRALAIPGVTSLATPTPLHLAAVLQHAAFLFSPEGGAGHLASFTGTPLLLLWSEGPYEKWHPRAEKLHVFRADLAHPQLITIDEVMDAIKEKHFCGEAASPDSGAESQQTQEIRP